MNRLRGIFPVVQTPFLEDGLLDATSLEREVAFCIQSQAHGMVYPVLASEFQVLTDKERRQGVETVLGTAAGMIPVVVGVAAPSAAGAAEYARHAAAQGASAVIALPPYIGQPNPEEVRHYYQSIADAADLPVFIQDAPPGLPMARLMDLLQTIEQVCYVKEENEPSAHNITALLTGLGEECWGVFGGAWCRWMMSEMARGVHGFMPSVEVVDIHVRIWNLYHAGQPAQARGVYNRLLPFINLGFCLGLRMIKEALVWRGIIATSTMRLPGATQLDEHDHRELQHILTSLADLFAPGV